MIAVSIARGRHRMMIAEQRHLGEQGAELVELRLDYLVRSVNLKRLLQDRPCPVIAACRRTQDGGKWSRSEEERRMLLRSAIAEGADFIDLEEEAIVASTATRKPVSTISLWKASGRQEIMQMSNLWQRRITSMR